MDYRSPALAFIFGFILMWLAWPHLARGHGHDYTQATPEIKQWMRGLKNRDGVSCCNDHDDEDVDNWETTPQGYRVRVKGQWLDVPPSAVLTVPNRLGYARVWLSYSNGNPLVRCFMPGSLT